MASHSGQPSTFSTIPPHLPFDQKNCPMCEQEIPPDKLEEIGGKIAAKEREQRLAITSQLEKQYEMEKARAETKAKADLESERQQGAIREARARDEAQKAAEKLVDAKLAEAEQVDERAEDLLEQQKKEIRWHENNWKKQGETVRGIQKAKADLENQLDLIIGTSASGAAA